MTLATHMFQSLKKLGCSGMSPLIKNFKHFWQFIGFAVFFNLSSMAIAPCVHSTAIYQSLSSLSFSSGCFLALGMSSHV